MTQKIGRLLDIQQKYRELGRLRLGQKGTSKSGKEIPTKLDVWRLTSASRPLLEHAAEKFGGEVAEWTNAPTEGPQFQLVTTTDTLPVFVPPGETVLQQYWELWSGGGCKKRCDGVTQLKADRPCSCPDEIEERLEKAKNGDACSPHTRLQVVLPDVPDVGVWRLETQSLNAASEIAAAFDILQQAAKIGTIIPATLRIDRRQIKTPGKPPQKFMVPVLEIGAKITDLVELQPLVNAQRQIGAGEGPQVPGALQPPQGVERRTLPGQAPALSTDPEAAEPPQSIDPVDLSQPVAPAPLPPWVQELPGDDGTIIDTANIVLADWDKPLRIETLRDLADIPEGSDFAVELRKRLDASTDGKLL